MSNVILVRDTLKQALEALEKVFSPFDCEDMRGGNVHILPSQAIEGLKAIAALKEAIKQQGEPVAYLEPDLKYPMCCHKDQVPDEVKDMWIPLYTLAPTIPELLFEAWDYGQFADDFDQPLAKPIRKAIRDVLSTAPKYKGEKS